MNHHVSFIIPHKGREAMLIDTLESISAQQCNIATFDIILVTQNDSVSDSVKQAARETPLTIVEVNTAQTISCSRNQGAEIAKGDHLAFLDADIELAPDWLETCLNTLLSRPNTKLVSAMQKESANAPALEKIRVGLSNAQTNCAVDFLPGRNLLLAKDTFYQAGQFPPDLVTCEDYYFTDKVNQLGELFYSGSTWYIHIGEDKALKPMFEKEIWRGQSNLASIKGRRIPLREWPSFLVPLFIPGMLIISLLAFLFVGFLAGLMPLLCAVVPFTLYVVRLKSIVGSKVGIWDIVCFYSVYFPARTIGTIGGISKTFGTRSHAK